MRPNIPPSLYPERTPNGSSVAQRATNLLNLLAPRASNIGVLASLSPSEEGSEIQQPSAE